MRPQLRLALVISQTSDAISVGVLFAGVPADYGDPKEPLADLGRALGLMIIEEA